MTSLLTPASMAEPPSSQSVQLVHDGRATTTRRSGGSNGKRRKEETQYNQDEEGQEEEGQISAENDATHASSHSRTRSKRLSRGGTIGASVASFSGLDLVSEVKINIPYTRGVALVDISNMQTATRRATKNNGTQQTITQTNRRTRSKPTTIDTSHSSADSIAINIIPSPPAEDEMGENHEVDVHDHSFSTCSNQPLHSSTGEDLDTSLDSACSGTSFRELGELRIHQDESNSSMDGSSLMPNSTFHLNSTINSTNGDATHLNASHSHDHSSFTAAFAAATSSNASRLTITNRQEDDVDMAPESSPGPSTVNFHDPDTSLFKQLHVPSSTPEVLTTAASTLTHPMANSLQLTNHSAMVVDTVGNATFTLPAPCQLQSYQHPSDGTLAAMAAAANGIAIPSAIPDPTAAATQPSMNGWAAHLLGQTPALAASSSSLPPPVSALIPADIPLREYAEDILLHMLEVECKYAANPAYMEQVQNDLSYVMRSILMDWLIEVSEEYQLCAQTLYLCVNYVDRFLSIHPVDRAKLQLLGVTALLLSSKYFEVRAPSIDEFIYISDATYSREQVLAMESALLNTLQFSLVAITPYDISTRLVERIGREIIPERTEWLAEMMMELFVLESQYLHYRPSVIAASALFLALYTTHANPWPNELEAACQLTVESIQLCVRAMHAAYLRMGPNGVVPGAGSPPLLSIRDKYTQPRFGAVAEIPPRKL